MRIAKHLSACGICSRRDAEKMIIDGRVQINGKILTSPAVRVTAADQVLVDGKLVKQQDIVRLWLYHKPVGLVTTHKDEHGRATVFQELQKQGLPRVISIGRLDLNSEGLLLITNNGELARTLELPSSKFDRVYKVRAYGDPAPILRAGLSFVVEGVKYSFRSLKLTKQHGMGRGAGNHWFEVILQEGKNREIRRVFEYFGMQVNRLIRTEYAGYKLGKLASGDIEEISIKPGFLDKDLSS